MKKITILVPCFNDAEVLPPLWQRLREFCGKRFTVVGKDGVSVESDMAAFEWEFLFVNDGSSDATLPLLLDFRQEDARVSVISLSRNFGKECAMLAGFDHCSGDAVLIMDADLQDPLEVIPEMIYWWEQGYDDVYGERISRGKESVARRWMSLAFYRLTDRLSSVDTLPNVGDFRLLDIRAVKALASMRETQRYTKGLYCWVGFRKKGVRFHRHDRAGGESSFSLFRLLNLAVDGLTSYTTAPLRMATVAGAMVSLSAFVYLVWIIVKTLLWSEPVAGFPSLMCVILFLGGFILLALGIIGEYVGRIFNEVKRRPPYIIESFYRGPDDDRAPARKK